MEASQETITEFNNNDDDDNNKSITVTNRKKLFKDIDLFKVKLIHIDDFPQPLFCVPAHSSQTPDCKNKSKNKTTHQSMQAYGLG